MKKVLLIALAVLMVMSSAISALAWSEFHVVHFASCPEDLPINAKAGDGTSSGVLTIRNDWSVNRNVENNTKVGDENDSWNYNSIVVFDDDGYDEFKVAKVVAPQCFVSKYTGFSDYEPGDAIVFEMKKDVVNGFAGAVLNFGPNDILPVTPKTTNIDDYFLTTYPAKSDDTAEYALATGYGFTFLKDSDTKVRLFVRTFNGDDLDVIYYDIDLGVNLSQSYYTYGFYYEADHVTFVVSEELDYETFYLCGTSSASHFPEDEEIGGYVCATINFSNAAKVDKKIEGVSLSDKYFRTATILNDKGEEIATTNDALICANDKNDAALMFIGEGTTAFVKTFIWTDLLSAPTTPVSDKNATPAPTTEPTATPDSTKAPADATEAPSADKTSAPETDDNGKKTDDNDKKTEEGKESGCGSLICGSSLLLACAAMLLFKKKEN